MNPNHAIPAPPSMATLKAGFNRLWVFLLCTTAIVLYASFPVPFHQQARSVSADSDVYYVSPTGDNANPGSERQPFRTFAQATSVLAPGDTLIVMNGSYREQLRIRANGSSSDPITIRSESPHGAILNPVNRGNTSTVNITGDYVTVEGFEVAGSSNYCIEVNDATHTTVANNIVHHCQDHGIYTDGSYTTIDNNEVFLSNLVNQERDGNTQWGSGIKVRVGGDNILISNNIVYHNYGEGIAVTRASNTTVANNTVYDNHSVNIYIDNSYNILVDKNFVYCTPDSGFEKEGQPASAFGMEEEPYDDWGAQLHDVTFTNNIASSCHRGLYYWRSDVDDIGLENISILHNTFYNMSRGSLFIEHTLHNQGNRIANNIFHQDSGEFGYVEDRAGFSIHHNLWSGGALEPWTNLIGKGDVTRDPRFLISPALTPDTFRLRPNSPAANAGIDVGVTDDFFGTTRSLPYDLGAYEVSASG